MSEDIPPRLIIASHNPGKIREFQAVLGHRWQVLPQAELGVGDVEETGSTFVENALIKARHACSQAHCAALADDSGLVVPALGGAPGLRSARYSGSRCRRRCGRFHKTKAEWRWISGKSKS